MLVPNCSRSCQFKRFLPHMGACLTNNTLPDLILGNWQYSLCFYCDNHCFHILWHCFCPATVPNWGFTGYPASLICTIIYPKELLPRRSFNIYNKKPVTIINSDFYVASSAKSNFSCDGSIKFIIFHLILWSDKIKVPQVFHHLWWSI